MFLGRQSHKMDPKGRLSIPVNHRNDLMASSEKAPILTNLSECLALYPHDAFLKIAEELDAKSPFKPETEAYRRFLISGADECPFDSQGRILVPQHLREHARLEREVTIAGVGPNIEIWDKTRFDQDNHHTRANFREIASVVASEGN